MDHASKTGGYVVYSTCSVCVEENEQVVQYALSRRPNVKLVETGLGFGAEGFRRYRGKVFDEGMARCRRFYPQRFNLDGFFVAKLRKVGPSPGGVRTGGANGINAPEGEEVDKTPIPQDSDQEAKDNTFASFNDSEDEKIIERARRQRLRRKGVNPKAKKPTQS